MNDYIHGYSPTEQERLWAQAAYWRDDLILPDLPYRPGESLLEIACGAGAVLGILGQAHPGLKLHGLDREPAQIERARLALRSRSIKAELHLGDALHAPWENNEFDHVYMMWFLEHIKEPVAALGEALRILKPGGSITINETDYSSLTGIPESLAITALRNSFVEVFDKSGCGTTGPRVKGWLDEVGFESIQETVLPFDISMDEDPEGAKEMAEYLMGFIEPCLGEMGALDGMDKGLIQQGFDDMRKAARTPGGRVGMTAWRLRAHKPA